MPRGASPKREKEYRELVDKFQKSGRYQGRQKEVASRIVNKQRAEYGETKGERRKDQQGKSPDRGLPIKDYQNLTVGQIERKLKACSPEQIQQIKRYEGRHKQRKTLLQKLDAQNR